MTQDEWPEPDFKSKRQEYNEKVHKYLRDSFNIEDFDNDPELADIETPMYNKYEDNDGGHQPTIHNIDDADPDIHERYVGSEFE